MFELIFRLFVLVFQAFILLLAFWLGVYLISSGIKDLKKKGGAWRNVRGVMLK